MKKKYNCLLPAQHLSDFYALADTHVGSQNLDEVGDLVHFSALL